jgi:DNA-binding NarL/FixJ family response regulator
VDVTSPPPLIGRAREREAIAGVLGRLSAGTGGIVAVEGEPGIGKSRLLAHLATCAAAAGCTVLEARASEYEADLPYALWTEALDGHLAEAGAHRLSRLGLADPRALAGALPALAELDGGPASADRHRTQRALRDLLERLATTRPLVICFDDVHWADPGSGEGLAALVHRLPVGPVLLAVAARAGQLRPILASALAAAQREDRATRLDVGPLNPAEARELVGTDADALYGESGGNPFYLEQLVRVHGPGGAAADVAGDGSVPPAVTAALAAELSVLTPDARRLLDAAAVVGDPFGPGLAAEVAELSEAAALNVLDELLARALVRPGPAPRRFAFRHPVVRHALYVATPGGWRLGAHARAAHGLEIRGAGPVERAHHVEQAAGRGDEQAIALLCGAARELQSLAPATAARFHAAALRLLPDRPEERARRTPIQARLAEAQAAAGDAAGARETLLDALRTAAPADRLALTVAVANSEWWLGRLDDARRRLHVALGAQPAQASPDRIRLRLALGLTALMSCELAEARGQTSDACDDARAIGDPVFEAAALAGGLLAHVSEAEGPAAAGDLAEATAALERLSPEQLATRLPAFWMLGRARRSLGEFEAALADLERGAAIALETGRENVRLQLTIESVATLIELGRPAEAIAVAEQGLELARLAGNPRMLLWARCALSAARLAAGDVSAALRAAEEAAESQIRPDFHAAGQPGWSLGAALTAAGNPERAVVAMLRSFGGGALTAVLPADRPAAAAELAEAQLASGDVDAAEQALGLGEAAAARSGMPWAAAVTGATRSAVLLARARPAEAVAAATAARKAATGAPLASALARLAEGRALAADGRRQEALDALIAAESMLDGFGALRRRDEAARELRKLGHRVRRPAREPVAGPLAPLTAREREIAVLVAAGRTNREVAEQLVLSARTIEAHLRNIYGKLGVRSRVELTRAVQRPAGSG